MSKYIEHIPLSRIRRVAILPGKGQSLEQVKGDADLIMNGGFYQFGNGSPTGHLKADGAVLGREAWNCWGFRWDTGADIRMDVVPDSGGESYISGVELLTRDKGAAADLSYRADIGGRRGRTALATDGERLILYCSGDGTADAATPEAVRDELAALGADRALLLDGGGSSQCDFHGKRISSSRRVHNYIAVWLTGEEPLPGCYTVTPADGLRIRSGPGTQYAKTGLYAQGAQVRLLELWGDWARTEQGWVCRSYLTQVSSETSCALWDTPEVQALFPGCREEDSLTCGQAAQLLRALGLV